MWSTDGHYYTVQLAALMMGFPQAQAYKLGAASEKPDSYVLSPSEMQERTTWVDGGLQQRYHALTGGYHGVELAITVYAILKTHSEQDLSDYLLHRFGDSYAHFDIENDRKGLTTYLTINQYVNSLDNFINSYLDENFEFLKATNLGDQVLSVLPFTKVKTAKSRAEIKKEFIDFMLSANHHSIFYTINSWQTLQDKILKSFPFHASQNPYQMYGETQLANCFTFGHASDGHDPDDIRKRKDLYLIYLDDLIELLSLKYNKNVSSQQKARIIGKFKRILEYSSQTPTDRLDAILSLEIELLKNPSANKVDFFIPIKYLAPNTSNINKQIVENVIGFNPSEDVKEQIDNLIKYFYASPDLSKEYVMGDVFPTSDGKAVKFTIFKK
ncbi:hypothetical protein D0T56_15290 [Dysgonomonas sp. 520]|nr:hypothetical protein [Dysgonomonas sp. 520]